MSDIPKVLVVDDDPLLLSLLCDTLESIGYEPVSEPDAESALRRIDREQIDIIVADINLPGIDGLELARQVKKHRSELPVILVTGVNMKNIRSRAYEAGADAFLDKPFRINVIENLMHRLLTRTCGSEHRVLIIDDNEQVRESIHEQLRTIGYNATMACSGVEALALLRQQKFDVLMTDLLMPEMDGLELSRDAKKISPHTSIVIFTGSVLDAQYAKNIQETADAFLSKPLRLQEMSDILSGFCPEI